MTGNARTRLIYGLSIAATALPFAFGLIRAARTGNDFRYLWVALASAAGAALAMKMARQYKTATAVALVLAVATAFAVSAGVLTGAAMSPILIVGLAFGSCFAAASLLLMLARRSANA